MDSKTVRISIKRRDNDWWDKHWFVEEFFCKYNGKIRNNGNDNKTLSYVLCSKFLKKNYQTNNLLRSTLFVTKKIKYVKLSFWLVCIKLQLNILRDNRLLIESFPGWTKVLIRSSFACLPIPASYRHWHLVGSIRKQQLPRHLSFQTNSCYLKMVDHRQGYQWREENSEAWDNWCV